MSDFRKWVLQQKNEGKPKDSVISHVREKGYPPSFEAIVEAIYSSSSPSIPLHVHNFRLKLWLTAFFIVFLLIVAAAAFFTNQAPDFEGFLTYRLTEEYFKGQLASATSHSITLSSGNKVLELESETEISRISVYTPAEAGFNSTLKFYDLRIGDTVEVATVVNLSGSRRITGVRLLS